MRRMAEIMRAPGPAATGIPAAVIAAVAVCCVSPCSADDALLIWVNGDSLTGELESASDQTLIWRSPLFCEPLQLRLPALRSVKFDSPDAAQVPDSEIPEPGVRDQDQAGLPVLDMVDEPDAQVPGTPTAPSAASGKDDGSLAGELRLLLRSGDVLSGRLARLTEDRAFFESVRFGRFDVGIEDLLSLQRPRNGTGLIYSGPRGLEGWQTVHRRSTGQEAADEAAVQDAQPPGAVAAGVEGRRSIRAGWIADEDGRLRSQRSDSAVFLPLDLPERFQIEVALESDQTLDFTMAIGRDPHQGLRVATWIDEVVAAQGTRFLPLRRLGPQDRKIHLRLFVDDPARRMLVYSNTGALPAVFSTAGLPEGSRGLLFRNGDFPLSITHLRVTHWDGRNPESFLNDLTRMETVSGDVHTGRLTGFDVQTQQLVLDREGTTLRVPVAEVNSVILPRGTLLTGVESGNVSVRWRDGSLLSGDLQEISAGRLTVRTPYSRQPVTSLLKNADWINLRQVDQDEALSVPGDVLTHARGSLRGELLVAGDSEAPLCWAPWGGLNAVPIQADKAVRIERRGTVQHFSDVAGFREESPDVIHLDGGDVLPCRVEAVTEEAVEFQSPLVKLRQLPVTRIRSIELQAPDRRRRTGFDDPGWQGISRINSPAGSGAVENGTAGSDVALPELRQAAPGDVIPPGPVDADLSSRKRRRRVGRENPDDLLSARGYDASTGRLRMSSDRPLWNPNVLTGDLVRFHVRWPRCNGLLVLQLFGSKPRWENETRGDGQTVVLLLSPGFIEVKDRIPSPQNVFGGVRRGGRPAESAIPAPDSAASVSLRVDAGELVVEINDQVARRLRQELAAGRPGSISIESVLMNGGFRLSNGRPQDVGAGAIELSRFEIDTQPGSSVLQFIRGATLDAALTVPRFRRDNPATHALLSRNGDMLRGRLIEMTGSQVVFESRLEPVRLERSRVAAIVWIEASGSPAGSEGAPAPPAPAEPVVALLANGYRVGLTPQRLTDGHMTGESALLGHVSFPAAAIRSLCLGHPEGREELTRGERWRSRPAREPDWDLPQSDGAASATATLIGSKAADFELPQLDGQRFRLSEHAGKVVVLDFWATWCGPCVAALPETMAVVNECDASQVLLVAINQQETADHVREFLAEKLPDLTVALDRDGAVAESYSVTGLPHTVVIGPDGTIASIQTGVRRGNRQQLQQTIRNLLDRREPLP